MNTLAILLALSPVIVGAYAYVGYPFLLRLRATRRDSPRERPVEVPMVSIVIPAYNEEAQIRGAIEAILAQDYPRQRRQVLILSDGSTDRTDDIVKEYVGQGVELHRMSHRSGKTAAENASCALIRGSIVINSDASIRLLPKAVTRLVACFDDPTVGVASSRDVSVAPGHSANTTEAGYVGYEMWVRSLETRTGGIVGASGSGYAIRTALHQLPVRPDLSRDFSAALTARINGYRAVSTDDALCLVPRTTSLRAEYRRKVRTISRGMETLIHNRRLLDFTVYGDFSWKLLSHKVCRWLVPMTAVPSALGLAVLAPHLAAQLVIVAALLVGAVAAAGALWPESRALPRAVSFVTFAVAANVAVIHAAWRVFHGHDDHLWEPTRRALAQPRTGSVH